MILSIGILQAGTLTNADIVKMVDAKLDSEIILTAIVNSEAKYDVSAEGLIDLSTKKVPQPIIEALIKRANVVAAPAAAPVPPAAPASVIPPAPAVSAGAMAPSTVLMIDGQETKPMRYLVPQIRAAMRGLGFGGMAQYAVLRGPAAATRTKNTQPSFMVSVPDQAQPDSYLTLASFAVRKNDTREVMIGGGYMSYSTGIHPDRVVPVHSEKTSDQSKAQKGFTIYTVTPVKPLDSGEYAVIFYTGEMQALVATWFSGTGNSYFDFGVDE